jgi:hypothetical protein
LTDTGAGQDKTASTLAGSVATPCSENDVTKIAQLPLSKKTLTEFNLPLILSQQFQYQSDMLYMFCKAVTVNKNVIKEN